MTFGPSTIPSRVGRFGAIMLLCTCIFVTYSNSLRNGFVSDDYYNISLNRETLSFKTVLTALIDVNGFFENDQLPYYRPFSRLFFLGEKDLFGANPSGYHAVNIALHMLCTILFYVTLLYLGSGNSISLLTALLFGIHPINSETVNFISSMNNILSAIFVIMSLLAFLHAEKYERKGGYLLSAIFLFLGMLSKETAVMLFPFLIIFKFRREIKKHTIRTILKWDMSCILYHVFILTAYLFLRYIAIGNSYIHGHLSGLAARVEQLLYIIPSYFSLLIVPVKLTFPHIVPKSFSGLMAPLTLGWLALIITVIYILRKRKETTEFWLIWFFINFIPISNLIPIPSYPMAERYLYLPGLGFFALAVDTLYGSIERVGAKKLSVISITCLILVFGVRTFKRNFDWREDVSIALSAVKVDPTSASNHYFLGLELYMQGRTPEAKHEFEEAITIDPEFSYVSWAYYYLGALNREAGYFNESKRYFMQSMQSGNQAARYILSSLFPGERNAGTGENRLMPITKTAIPFIPEVNDRMFRLNPGPKPRSNKIQYQYRPIHDAYQSGQWHLFHRFSTGTELYFDPAAVHKENNNVSIVTRQLLAPSDRLSFALRIIRFPLVRAVEARFNFTINCPQKVYMISYMDFRDGEGTILGKIYPAEEEDILYEYLPPGSSMRSLSDKICLDQFHKADPLSKPVPFTE